AGGQVELAGRARAERATGGPPLAIEFASEYRAAAARLELSRLDLDWGEGLRLRGSGDVELEAGGTRVALDLAGPVAGSPVTLARGGGIVLALTAGSRGEAPWPLAVEVAVADLGRLPTPSSLPVALTGHAQVRGELDRGRFAGVLTAELPRVELRFTSPIVVT